MSGKRVMLEPDRDQLEIFVEALLRHAGAEGYVSLRSFLSNDKVLKPIQTVKLKGTNPRYLVDVAVDQARRAANNPEPAVFCPPIATFNGSDGWRAREVDLHKGLVLSVEADAHPEEARATLEEILGATTVTVRSGGQWIDPDDGLPQDKLHLHWRLTRPAVGPGELAKLKQARLLATTLVGGDPSNVPTVHCLRWPGSWHRKGEPRLCEIVAARPDVEIELDAALEALLQATPAPASKPASDSPADNSTPEDWPELVADIISGKSYHRPLRSLAARLVGSGTHDGTTVKLLRALMAASTAPHDDPRWQPRYDAIPRHVSTAREKFSANNRPSAPPLARPLHAAAKELRMMTFNPITFMVPNLIPSEGVTLVCSKPKVGKSWLLLDIAIGATMDRFVLGDKKPAQGDFLYLALEDSLRRLQGRMTKLLGAFTGEWPEGLDFRTQWKRVDQGGLDDIRAWINDRRAAGRKVAAVAIDVLAMIRPVRKAGEPAYEGDYRAITGLQQLAMELGIAIVIAHHTRKAEAEDLIDKVSGTFGIVGAADTIIVIERKAAGAVFDVRGRDVEGDELAVQFNRDTCRWTVLGAAEEVFRSDARGKIMEALADSPVSLTAQTVTAVTGLKHGTVRVLLHRMAKNGDIIHLDEGKYALPTTPHISYVTVKQ